MISVSAIALSARTWGRSWLAPNEQFSPMVSGLAWRTACQNASTVWPERLRPDRSVSGIDSISGTSRPRAPSRCFTAMIAALQLSVSNTVSTRMKSAPPSIRASACS